MAEEDVMEKEMTSKKASAYYPSALQFAKGNVPKDKFWKYFIKVDTKDRWNWICLAAAIFLFWWSFKTIFAAFS